MGNGVVRARKLALAVDALGLLLALVALGNLLGRLAAGAPQTSDFTAYYLAARAHTLGLDYYRRETIEALAAATGIVGDLGPYLYPPLFAALLSPLAGLDYPIARWLWATAALLSVGVSLFLLKSAAGVRLGPGWRGPTLAFLVLFPPVGDDLLKGQITWLLLVILSGAWLAHARGRVGLAGALVGLAAAIKLAPALVLLYFALRREGRALAAGLGVAVLLAAASFALAGVEPHVVYACETLPSIGIQVGAAANVSLPGLAARLFDPASLVAPLLPDRRLYFVALALALGTLACAFVRAVTVEAAGRGANSGFALAVGAMILAGPSSQAYVLVLALLPLAAVLANVRTGEAWDRRGVDLLLVAALLLSVPPNPRLQPALAAAWGLPATLPALPAAVVAALPTAGLALLTALLVAHCRRRRDCTAGVAAPHGLA